MHTDLPDVLGWELPRAVEECRASGVPVAHVITKAPLAGHQRVQGESEVDWEDLRVVAVRPGDNQGVLLVVCAECWTTGCNRREMHRE